MTLKKFGESEICKTNIAMSIHKNIFWLQISMDDILLMKIAKSEDDLRSNELDSWFLESFLFIYIVVNVSSWQVLKEEVDSEVILEDEVH